LGYAGQLNQLLVDGLQLLATQAKENTKQIVDAINGAELVRKHKPLTALGEAEIPPNPPLPAILEITFI
jgi:hypothetical protein